MLLGLIALKQNQKKTAYDYIIKMLKNVKQTLSSMQVFSFKILDAQFIGICCLILIQIRTIVKTTLQKPQTHTKRHAILIKVKER